MLNDGSASILVGKQQIRLLVAFMNRDASMETDWTITMEGWFLELNSKNKNSLPLVL